MDKLPEELLAVISEHCDHASLKMLRLVDARFRAVSTPGVFEHFYMALFQHSLVKLESLAKSPLSKHVKQFTIFSDVLPSWPKPTWLKAIDFRVSYSDWMAPYRTADRTARDQRAKDYEALPRHDFTPLQLELGYAEYQDAIRSQQNWRQARLMRPFQEYFAMLPNLIEAKVQCITPFSGRTNEWPVFKALRKKIFVGPDDWMFSTDYTEDNYMYLSGHAAVSMLAAVGFRASFSDNSQITRLSVHSSHLEPYQKLLIDARAMAYQPHVNALRVYGILDGFVNLTSLHLHIPHATLSARFNGPGMSAESIEILQSARHLQHLDLRYGDDELSPDDDIEQLQQLFERGRTELIWPKLTHLTLATNIPADTLIGFLHRHSSTLRSLELRDMLIHDVDSALEQIPRVIQLEHVYAECLWTDSPADASVEYTCVLARGTDFDDAYEKAVKAYLLGRSDNLPMIERDGGREVDGWHDDDQNLIMNDLDVGDESETD